ncbi:MAG: ferrous iron transport protein B [Bdellovibrionales bacterium]
MHQSLSSSFAVVGAPNAGKTTVYNWITGSSYKSVNYPGSTVEYAVGQTLPIYGEVISVMDTPGIYSLNAQSPEERVTVTALYQHDENHQSPHALLVVVDGTQLSRHLFLVKQLLESNFQIVLAVTMNDLLRKKNLKVNAEKLSKYLGIPVVLVDGRLGGGIQEAVGLVRTRLSTSKRVQKPLPTWSSSEVEKVYADLDAIVADVLEEEGGSHQLNAQKINRLSHRADQTTLAIDRVLLHPVLGLLFFILILGSLFSSIYWLAAPLMDLVDGFFGEMGGWTAEKLPPGLLADFVSDGIFAGFGSVLVFVPQIFILFLGMVILEDWGYLARAATIIDRPLSKLGLNGRSFVPLLSGFACAIPAMMAARTINSRRERLLTIFIIPLMSCSARLPVYALLLGFLYQGTEAWKAGLALTAIYLGSLVVGSITAAIAGKILKLESPGWFMLELPAYRRPHLRNVFKSAFDRTYSYVRKAGPAILVFSLIIWTITVFPRYDIESPSERLAESYAAKMGQAIEPVMQPMGVDWRVGVGLISAFAAREVFVSSLALIFNVTDEDEEALQTSLLKNMEEAKAADGNPLFTTATVWGLIVFFMIALQCLTTYVVAQRESGSRTFALIQITVFTLMAYVSSVFVVQSLRFFGVS